MFVARAGLRQLRPGDDGNHPFAYRRRKKKEKTPFRCYVPFMWPTCVSILVGFLILVGGIALCVSGYYAAHGSDGGMDNSTSSWNVTEAATESDIRILTFVGPIFMGVGCFTIVVACVVVCETRDRMVKILHEAEKQKKKASVKPDFYDLVIKQFKDKHRATLRRHSKAAALRRGSKVAAPRPAPIIESERQAEIGKAGKWTRNFFKFRRPQSAKPTFSHIGGALRSIPAQIFTIDVERSRDISMQPVESLSHTLRVNSAGSNKYPSTSCIHDLLKSQQQEEEEEDNQEDGVAFKRPLAARLSWLRRPKTAFRDKRPMHRLNPLPATDALYHSQHSSPMNDGYDAGSSVRLLAEGHGHVTGQVTSLKDAGKMKGEFCSDSDHDEGPEGCICALNDKDSCTVVTVDTSTEASEVRCASRASSPPCAHATDSTRGTLLLHQASVHSENGASSQEKIATDPDPASSSSASSSPSSSSPRPADKEMVKRTGRDSVDSFFSESSFTSGQKSDDTSCSDSQRKLETTCSTLLLVSENSGASLNSTVTISKGTKGTPPASASASVSAGVKPDSSNAHGLPSVEVLNGRGPAAAHAKVGHSKQGKKGQPIKVGPTNSRIQNGGSTIKRNHVVV